jgi:hypothetical protein
MRQAPRRSIPQSGGGGLLHQARARRAPSEGRTGQAIDLRFEIRNALTPLGAAPASSSGWAKPRPWSEWLDDGSHWRALSFPLPLPHGDYPRAIEAGALNRSRSLDDPSEDRHRDVPVRAYQSSGVSTAATSSAGPSPPERPRFTIASAFCPALRVLTGHLWRLTMGAQKPGRGRRERSRSG